MSEPRAVPPLKNLAAAALFGNESETYNFPGSERIFSVPKILLFETNTLIFNQNTKSFDHNKMMLTGESYVVEQPKDIGKMKIENIALNMFAVPKRPENYRLYDPERLKSVLIAMRGGTPLPPITSNQKPHTARTVANGFHRYLASVILGFPKIPTLVEPSASASASANTSKKYVPPHLR